VEIIPVIDLMGGIVVHAKAGLRDDYDPIKSVLTAATDLGSVVTDLSAFFPFKTMYIADLDAIAGREFKVMQYQQLVADFPHIIFWLDAGIRTAADNLALTEIAGIRPIVASETLQDFSLLSDISGGVLSLDFHHGQFLGDMRLWQQTELWPNQVIVMNLDVVGSGRGPDIALLKKVRTKNPQANRVVAGGVRGIEDLRLLRAEGVEKVLIASALHDGSLSYEMLEMVT